MRVMPTQGSEESSDLAMREFIRMAFSVTNMIEPKNPIVAGVADPGNAGAARTENGSSEAAADDSCYNFPNSKKIYVPGTIHPEVASRSAKSR
jgi:hypothetical protein